LAVPIDTREKILSWQEACRRIEGQLAGAAAFRIVTGHFDPVLAVHARALEEIAASDGRPGVIITEPPDPLLSAEARAVLVAALGAVEWVALAPESGLAELLERIPRTRLVRAETEHLAIRADFIRRVRARHSAA
jgi:hypothetical protein